MGPRVHTPPLPNALLVPHGGGEALQLLGRALHVAGRHGGSQRQQHCCEPCLQWYSGAMCQMAERRRRAGGAAEEGGRAAAGEEGRRQGCATAMSLTQDAMAPPHSRNQGLALAENLREQSHPRAGFSAVRGVITTQ